MTPREQTRCYEVPLIHLQTRERVPFTVQAASKHGASVAAMQQLAARAGAEWRTVWDVGSPRLIGVVRVHDNLKHGSRPNWEEKIVSALTSVFLVGWGIAM